MSASSPSWTAPVAQQHRAEDHLSVAIPCKNADLAKLGIMRGAVIEISVGSARGRAYFHGSVATWSKHSRYFGKASAKAIAERYPLEAYIEGSRTAGGVKVPGHTEWLRVRATSTIGSTGHAVCDAAIGSAATVALFEASPPTTRPAAALVKDGGLDVDVLTSHPHGLVLAFDLIALKKLGAEPSAWYRIELGNDVLPFRAGRGISFTEEESVWQRTTALLFEFIAHWDNEKKTVCYVTPMQYGWKGRFPNWDAITMPVVAVGERVRIMAETSSHTS